MKKDDVQPGTTAAPGHIRITIASEGPYIVYGRPPMRRIAFVPNASGYSCDYAENDELSTESEPTYLCRCGCSNNKPYCDGSHTDICWDPELTAPVRPLLDGARIYRGPLVDMSDNPEFCISAGFCDVGGGVWNLVTSNYEKAKEMVVKECNLCPSGRLSAWDKETGEPIEPHYDPSIGVLEDGDGRKGALWIRGGITISREDGTTYEIRNRVTLCRCGKSSNKPFCDGSHLRTRW